MENSIKMGDLVELVNSGKVLDYTYIFLYEKDRIERGVHLTDLCYEKYYFDTPVVLMYVGSVTLENVGLTDEYNTTTHELYTFLKDDKVYFKLASNKFPLGTICRKIS